MDRVSSGWKWGVAAVVVGFTLACTGASPTTTVEGERAEHDGGCPPGETCSDNAPDGLMFRGLMLYDEGVERLGPVLVGGRFDLAFSSPSADLSSGFEIELNGDTLESAGTSEDPPKVELWGVDEGRTTVEVVEPGSGALFDRLTLEAVVLEDVVLDNVTEPGRPHLYAGCDEMIGLHLIARGGTLRAFDQSVRVLTPTDVVPDPFVWDCFQYGVPEGVDEVTFEIEAAGQIWVRTVAVVELAPDAACPQTVD